MSLKRIGLTGGVAAGKSTVADLFRTAGLTVIDLDQIGRNLTQDNPKLIAQIKALAGEDLGPGSTLDRRKLRDILFSVPKVRRNVEALLHPLILKEFEGACAAAESQGKDKIVCEAALLIESGYHQDLDSLIVVMAPSDTRRARLIARDHLSPELADKMMNSQADDSVRRRLATQVIENNGGLENLRQKVKVVIGTL